MDRFPKCFPPGNWKLAVALALSILLHVLGGLYAAPSAGTGSGPYAASVLRVRLPGATWQAQPDAVLPGAEVVKSVSRRADLGGEKREIAAQGLPVDYIDARHLTALPYPLEDVDVAFPSDIAPQDGKVVIELLIEPDGRAAKVTSIHSELPEEYGRQVVGIFSDKRYAPGKVHERTVPSRLLVEVVFDTSGLF